MEVELEDKNSKMFAVSTGISFDEVVRTKVYYCKAYKCRRICAYLGLYKNKSIVKIGKIKKIIEAYMLEGNLVTELISGESIKEEDVNLIKESIEKVILENKSISILLLMIFMIQITKKIVLVDCNKINILI